MSCFDQLDLHCLETPVWIYDVEGYQILWANSAALKLWEADSFEELRQRDFKTDCSDAVQQRLLKVLEDCKQERSIECWWRLSPKGIDKQVFIKYSAMATQEKHDVLLIEAVHSDLLNRSVGDVGKSSLLALFNNNGELLSFNPPFREQFGLTIHTFTDLVASAKDIENFSTSKYEAQEHDVLLNTSKGQRWHHLELQRNRQSNNVVATLLDIHDRKLSEIKHVQASITDPLTGLLNRRGLLDQLNTLKAIHYTLFYIDLDGFKPINDSYGHAIGDTLLSTVADILRHQIHPDAVCARLGGDEFIVVITQSLCDEEIKQLAKALVTQLSMPMQLDTLHRTLISASIGIVHKNDLTMGADQILVCADSAMYIAKNSGRNRFIQYAPGMEEHLTRRSVIVQGLEQAMDNGELSLHYQTLYKSGSPKVVGAEALLRWQHPVLGNIPPLEIIAAAEETGRISALENWVIRRSCLELFKLKQLYGQQFTVGVNISGAHLTQINFVDDILSVLKETNTQPQDIVLELTESVLINSLESGHSTLKHLRDLGFIFAIDDFGTGYSSLAYLSDIPADFVKVDKSFIDKITTNPHTVSFIRDLCQNLNMECLVEGVETLEQAQILDQLKIDYRQGFYYARPQPLDLMTV